MADAPKASNAITEALQQAAVQALNQPGGLKGMRLNISPRGGVQAGISLIPAESPQPLSPVEAAENELKLIRLKEEIAQANNLQAERIRKTSSFHKAGGALTTINQAISAGRLPFPSDIAFAEQMAQASGDPTIIKAIEDAKLAAVKMADAEAERTVVRLAGKVGVSPGVVPKETIQLVKDHIVRTGQPLDKRTTVAVKNIIASVAREDNRIAALQGKSLLRQPPTKDALREQMTQATTAATRQALGGDIKGAKKLLAATSGTITEGLAELSKPGPSGLKGVFGSMMKHPGKTAIGAALTAALLGRFITGEQEGAKQAGGGMPSMQELMIMKAISDIQTQQGLAESLIGLRGAQSAKAQSQNELQTLQAMKILQGLGTGNASIF